MRLPGIIHLFEVGDPCHRSFVLIVIGHLQRFSCGFSIALEFTFGSSRTDALVSHKWLKQIALQELGTSKVNFGNQQVYARDFRCFKNQISSLIETILLISGLGINLKVYKFISCKLQV